MPQHYKAKTDHRPIDYWRDLNSIARHFRAKGDHFLAIFVRWKLPIPEHDDVGALIEQVTRRLIDFALVCDAVPMRTPLKLKATVTEIAKRPSKFLSNASSYDPEAVARIYDTFTRGSPENRLILSRFEAGEETRPTEEAITHAAFKVVDDLDEKMADDPRVGGQRLVLQRELIQDLAAIFLRFGGSLKRATQFDNDLPAKYVYHGPFHDFLKLVLSPVRTFAGKAGFKMESIRSLVGIPNEDNHEGRKDIDALLGKSGESRRDRAPTRAGNFFELHARRVKSKQH